MSYNGGEPEIRPFVKAEEETGKIRANAQATATELEERADQLREQADELQRAAKLWYGLANQGNTEKGDSPMIDRGYGKPKDVRI